MILQKEEGLQKEELQQVLHAVEQINKESPREPLVPQTSLDQLQAQIVKLNHQLSEARTAKFELQQLKVQGFYFTKLSSSI